MGESANLKNNILTVLSGLMSSETDLRRASEDRRKALEYTDDYAIALIDVMMDYCEPLEERVLASTLLKQYIVSYWRIDINNLSEPIILEEVKEQIKKFLPAGLSDNSRVIRGFAAHSMAIIAFFDYPEHWPNLMSMVESLLQSSSNESVDGTVKFLKECLTFEVGSLFTPTLFNCLYDVVGSKRFLTTTRSSVISLVTAFVISDLERNYDYDNHVLNNVGTKFCQMLAFNLSEPYSIHSDFQLKSEIIGGAFIQFLLCDKAKETSKLIVTTLPIIWEILTKCATEYIQIISSQKLIPRDAHEDENNPVYFMKLVTNVFALLNIVASCEDMNKHLMPILTDVLYSSMIFICITPELEQEYLRDENSYCADEFANMVNICVRTDLKSMLMLLAAKLSPQKMLEAVSMAIVKILGGGYDIKPNDSLNWRVNESVMCTIGCLSELYKTQSHQYSFDLYLYLRNASLLITDCRNVILLARVMLAVGRFSCCMAAGQVQEHLATIAIHLRSDHHILRNAAVRALNFHCLAITNLRGNCARHNSEEMRKVRLTAFGNVFHMLLDSLINITDVLSPNIFSTTIRNICDITQMNESLTPNFAYRLVPFILHTLQKNTQNALIVNRVKELIIGLSKNRVCGEYIQSSLMQPVSHEILYPTGNTPADRAETQSVSLYILSILIEFASSEAIKNGLFMEGFMLVINTINATDDILVIEISAVEKIIACPHSCMFPKMMGTRCLCVYLLECSAQVHNERVFEAIVEVMYRFLEVTRDEQACKHFDKLFVCMYKAFNSELATHNEKLVKFILSKLNFATTCSVQESFNITFLIYFYYNNELITDLLYKIPGPSGGNALGYIIKSIVTFDYQSTYGRYMFILVLCKIVENMLLREDARTSCIIIDGDEGVGDKDKMPLLAFVFKRLINEFFVQKSSDDEYAVEDDFEEYEDYESDSDEYIETDNFLDLCKVLDKAISPSEMEGYLMNYMRTFSVHESFRTLTNNHLTEVERRRLFEILMFC